MAKQWIIPPIGNEQRSSDGCNVMYKNNNQLLSKALDYVVTDTAVELQGVKNIFSCIITFHHSMCLFKQTIKCVL